jgi:polyhydroxyalkanoate synthase subunit PhaE
MDPLESMTAMGELWSRGARSFAEAQANLFGALNRAAGPAPAPDFEAARAAQAAYAKAWADAQAVAAGFTASLGGKADGGKTGGGKTDASDPVAAEVLAKVFDPRGWLSASSEIDAALSRFAEGPQFSDLFQVERKFAVLTAAWTALRRRNLEHNTLMLEAWTRATGAFSQAVNARTEAGRPLESARALMALWIETANDVLVETQRSDAFLRSQRESLKAATDLRLAQQDIAEFYSQAYGYPTRAELDDLHKTVTELRREMRALKRKGAGRGNKAGQASKEAAS